MRLEDLPPHLRAQAEAQLAPQKRKRTTRREAGVDGPGRCGCGDEFPTYRAWERGHQGPGHRRFEAVL